VPVSLRGIVKTAAKQINVALFTSGIAAPEKYPNRDIGRLLPLAEGRGLNATISSSH
jgi:hypothetical protein